MRQTALSEGFNEQEVAGVYDKRMLNILLKAHLYDQGMAVRPQAVIPGKGKALVPGSARPLIGECRTPEHRRSPAAASPHRTYGRRNRVFRQASQMIPETILWQRSRMLSLLTKR